MKRIQEFESSGSIDINLSPLIDMMFLLLIFFIVTTAFVEELGVEINKPRAASAVDLETKSITIGVGRNGKVYYGAKAVGMNGLRGLVSRLLRNDDRPVIIMGDALCPGGVLVDVIDECKLAGAKKVSLSTDRE